MLDTMSNTTIQPTNLFIEYDDLFLINNKHFLPNTSNHQIQIIKASQITNIQNILSSQSIKIIINTIIDQQTRLYIDELAHTYDIPLIQIYTNGSKAYFQTIVPSKTAPTRIYREGSIPICNIKYFPTTLKHLVLFSIEKFNELCKIPKLNAIDLFNNIFQDIIDNLLSKYPPNDSLHSIKWENKKIPHSIPFNTYDPLHNKFITFYEQINFDKFDKYNKAHIQFVETISRIRAQNYNFHDHIPTNEIRNIIFNRYLIDPLLTQLIASFISILIDNLKNGKYNDIKIDLSIPIIEFIESEPIEETQIIVIKNMTLNDFIIYCKEIQLNPSFIAYQNFTICASFINKNIINERLPKLMTDILKDNNIPYQNPLIITIDDFETDNPSPMFHLDLNIS